MASPNRPDHLQSSVPEVAGQLVLPRPVLLAAMCLTAAAINYAVALTFSRGFLHSTWLIASLGTFLLAAGGMVFLRRRSTEHRTAGLLAVVAIAGTAVQVALLMLTPMSDAFERLPAGPAWVLRGCVVAIAISGIAAAFVRRSFWVTALLGVACALHVFIGSYLIRQGEPFMDVYVFHQDSAAALLDGVNPYAITFKNIYGEGAWVYSPAIMKDGRVLFGFPYPPASLLAYLPSYALTGESRYAHLLAMTFTAILIWRIGRSTFSTLVAVLVLTVPVGWRVVEFSWTEPFLIVAFALVAWVGVHRPRWLAVALGAFLCAKQYCIVFVPLVFLLLPRPLSWRTSGVFLLQMIGTGAILSLPLALWDWPAFWNSNVTIQVMQPFRGDSFSFQALLVELLYGVDAKPPEKLLPILSLLPFAALLPVYAIAYFRSERSIGGFVLALALTDMVFLFLNRQAFLNYHLFAQCALLIAAVVLVAEKSATPAAHVDSGLAPCSATHP